MVCSACVHEREINTNRSGESKGESCLGSPLLYCNINRLVLSEAGMVADDLLSQQSSHESREDLC